MLNQRPVPTHKIQTPDRPDAFLPSEAQLNLKRRTTDPAADAVAKQVFQSGSYPLISRALALLVKNNQPLPAELPDFVKDFFQETAPLPPFADPKQMQQGSAFFARHAQAISSVLGYYSLPYCYAAADGAEVLYLSQKIRNNTTQRLLETGQFVLEVMAANAFEPEGKGIRSCQKVRLMHATVRYHILSSNRWNMDWGMPINQEDMAGTNLAFSYITLRGLDKLGIRYTEDEAGAFLHLWKVIGYLMGVETDLLPDTLRQAYQLDKKISTRHFRKSEAGTALTQALLASFKDFVPNPAVRPLLPSFLRYFLGEEVADLLDVPKSRAKIAEAVFFGGLRSVNALTNSFSDITGTSGVLHSLMLQLQQQSTQLTDFKMPEKIMNG